MGSSLFQRRIDAARGKIPCDLIFKNVQFLDVFSCAWKMGDIAIVDGLIVGLEAGLSAKRVINMKGKWVVPGFIDAHVHLESSMMTPRNFQNAVLPKGTTSAICDPHELANVMGIEGIQYFLDSASQLELNLWVMMSSCVPATDMETNGGGTVSAEELVNLSSHPKALGLAEMMNMPGVIHGDPQVMKKLQAFSELPIDGHCPLLRGNELSAYASTGISSCHESSELGEAREKLSKGISVWIREGSVAKDLKALSSLLTLATSTSVGFCTDDRNPLDIAEEGHIDHLIRSAIQCGVPAEVVYRSASWSVAKHYGIASGLNRVGAIAPGYGADLVVLDDKVSCAVQSVLIKGNWAAEIPLVQNIQSHQSHMKNSIRAKIPEIIDLEGPQGRVHVIGVLKGKIITEHRIKESSDEGVAKLSVLERYGGGSKPANGYVEGFGIGFKGAIASSVGHDSHNLIVVGSSSADMRVALAVLVKLGGGFCVVKNSYVLAELPLPFGGLMSDWNPQQLSVGLRELKKASLSVGCDLPEPFLQLAFLSLPVIPSLKLTNRGLVDVNAFKIIGVGA